MDKKIEEFGIKLKYRMDYEDHMYDLNSFYVVGSMTKKQKTKYISKFLYKKNMLCNIKVLCATSGVGNAGIYSPNFRVLYPIDIAPYLLYIY